MDYYSAVKKNEIMPFVATWMDLETVILSQISQTEKEKYRMTSYFAQNVVEYRYGINPKNQGQKYIKSRKGKANEMRTYEMA